MRPDRFQQLLVAAARSVEGVTKAALFSEVGHDRHPYGVQVEAAGKSSRWQVVALSRPGDDYSKPEGAPALGDRPELPADPSGSAGTPAHLEAALTAAVLAADPGEIAQVELYSTQPEPPKVGYGATLTFHDGSKIFLNHVR